MTLEAKSNLSDAERRILERNVRYVTRDLSLRLEEDGCARQLLGIAACHNSRPFGFAKPLVDFDAARRHMLSGGCACHFGWWDHVHSVYDGGHPIAVIIEPYTLSDYPHQDPGGAANVLRLVGETSFLFEVEARLDPRHSIHRPGLGAAVAFISPGSSFPDADELSIIVPSREPSSRYQLPEGRPFNFGLPDNVETDQTTSRIVQALVLDRIARGSDTLLDERGMEFWRSAVEWLGSSS